MVWWLAHSSKLVCYWMRPKVSKKQSTNENKKGSISSTCGSFHLHRAYGLHVEIQDHNKEDDCYERHDERWPRLYFTLQQKKISNRTAHQKSDCIYSIKCSSLELQVFSLIHKTYFYIFNLSHKHLIPDTKRDIYLKCTEALLYFKYFSVCKRKSIYNVMVAMAYSPYTRKHKEHF